MGITRSNASAEGALLPLRAAERIEVIDAIRGFALFGVLLANSIWISQDGFVAPQVASLPTATIDRLVRDGVQFFIEWKFYTLFSFLFGLGFAVQLTRGERRGRAVLRSYVRRLSVLLTIGLVHAYLIWYGDILHHYALLGFLLILFRKRSDRIVLVLGMTLAVIVPAAVVIGQLLLGPESPPAPDAADLAAMRARFLALTSGSYVEVLGRNAEFSLGFWTSGFALHFLPSILGKVLLGFYVGRRGLLEKPETHVGLFQRLLVWGLVFGLAGNALWLATTKLTTSGVLTAASVWVLAAQLPVHLGVISMAALYLSAIVLLWRVPAWQARLVRLVPVGRMALTNYLAHSFMYLAVFYGFGFSLLGRVGAAFCLALSVVVFAGQMVVSSWWLQRFEYGPAEWLWRSLTYGTRQPMRLSTRPSATGA